MSKNKEQKKKERERRVAQKKHAAAMKKAQEKTAGDGAAPFPQQNKFTPGDAAPKTPYVTSNSKKPFNYRRSGG
jgi:hypothetical protein